jgi:hypothetical protein
MELYLMFIYNYNIIFPPAEPNKYSCIHPQTWFSKIKSLVTSCRGMADKRRPYFNNSGMDVTYGEQRYL